MKRQFSCELNLTFLNKDQVEEVKKLLASGKEIPFYNRVQNVGAVPIRLVGHIKNWFHYVTDDNYYTDVDLTRSDYSDKDIKAMFFLTHVSNIVVRKADEGYTFTYL